MYNWGNKLQNIFVLVNQVMKRICFSISAFMLKLSQTSLSEELNIFYEFKCLSPYTVIPPECSFKLPEED